MEGGGAGTVGEGEEEALGTTSSEPSTSSSDSPPEHISTLGVDMLSSARTTALAAPIGHAPPDHACRPLHDDAEGIVATVHLMTVSSRSIFVNQKLAMHKK